MRKNYEKDILIFQVSDETLNRTALGDNHSGHVNMELPLTLNSLLSGHLVQGHVDEVIHIQSIKKLDSELWYFSFSNANKKYIVDKGSITINGISLTVVEPKDDSFSVAIIEETFNRTNLQHLSVDDAVNVEYDIVIKYLEIYSDLPQPLLSEYSFFKGLSEGVLTFSSIIEDNTSSSNLIIENFKVVNAPGVVKLLSLADFGGLADLAEGDGLSFEKMEIKMTSDKGFLKRFSMENQEKLYSRSTFYNPFRVMETSFTIIGSIPS